MGRTLFALALLPWALLAGSAAIPAVAEERQGKPRIAELKIQRAGDRLHVSYRLENGFTPETMEKIQAGIPVRFRHKAEVTTRHWMPLWAPRTVATTIVETTVTYDSLTHRFKLFREIEVSSRKKGKDQPLTQQESTVLESVARAWMTELTIIPPMDISTLPTGTTARVRVESALGRKWVFVVPTRRTVAADQKLEP